MIVSLYDAYVKDESIAKVKYAAKKEEIWTIRKMNGKQMWICNSLYLSWAVFLQTK